MPMKPSDWQRDDIRKNWGLTPGEQFTQSAWGGAKSQGLQPPGPAFSHGQHCQQQGRHRRRHPEGRSVHRLRTGAAYTWPAATELQHPDRGWRAGCRRPPRYDPEGMRRIARLPVGEEYKQTSLLDAQQRLSNSGYFDSVF
jgi:translocation and assembly module TamA